MGRTGNDHQGFCQPLRSALSEPAHFTNGVFFLLPALGAILDAILRTHWGSLINFTHMISIVWAHLFRLQSLERHSSGFDTVPLWAAWVSLLSLCVFCFWLLDRKLQAREVER